jgi:hypothetical protein
MERFVSPALEVSTHEADDLTRADIVFYNVDHSGESYVARVFVNAPDADMSTPLTKEAGFVGLFTVFGHAGCYGDPGHCDPTDRTTDAFDLRAPHPLAKWTKTVIVHDGLDRLTSPSATVTVVATAPKEGKVGPSDAMSFSSVRLITYAS